jgi:hypothetical protein
MRVLLCAAASIALILAATLAMDWFRLTFTAALPGAGRIAIDLRNMRICQADHGCAGTSISLLPGMFPSCATVTLWSCLGFAVLVAFQAGAHVLTGAANDAFTKLGYVLALTAISLAVATAYMFGPDAEVPVTDLAAKMGLALARTWAPLTLLTGLVAGFAALYMSVSPGPGDLGATYKPVTITPVPQGRARTASVPLQVAAATSMTAPPDASISARAPGQDRGNSLARRAAVPRSGSSPGLARSATGSNPAITRPGSNPAIARPGTGSNPAIARLPPDPVVMVGRLKSGPLPPVPAHLRNRLEYVAITAELTAGGIDARREDGASRLVLWRDVVGVVARRMPPAYDNATFIDIVSTAGSTLRIVPWTRLTGEPIDAELDQRPRGVVERVVAMCPGAKVDPATRLFLDTGEAVQLPDLETLHAHDERLA